MTMRRSSSASPASRLSRPGSPIRPPSFRYAERLSERWNIRIIVRRPWNASVNGKRGARPKGLAPLFVLGVIWNAAGAVSRLPDGDVTDVDVLAGVDGPHLLGQVTVLLDEDRVLARLHVTEPEVSVTVGGRLVRLAVADLHGRDLGVLGALVHVGLEDRAGDERLGQADVPHPRFDVLLGLERLRLGDQVPEFLFFAESEGADGTGVHAARLGPAVVQEVRAERALLGDVQRVVEVDHAFIRTRREAELVAAALLGVDDHGPVVALVDGVDVAGLDARGVVAVLADAVHVGHLDLGHLTAHVVVHPVPELPRVGLRLGDGRPVVADVLVLAGHLAVVAAVADVQIDDEDLAHHSPPQMQASRPGPAHGWNGFSKASGYLCLRSSMSVFSMSTRKPLTACPTAFLEVVLRGTMVLIAPPRSSSPGTIGSHLAPWSI